LEYSAFWKVGLVGMDAAKTFCAAEVLTSIVARTIGNR
jgi:hypothetical protein